MSNSVARESFITTARLERWAEILWGLVLFTLPVTSFRYLPSFFGTTIIRPLAIYPVVLLLPLLLWIAWRRGKFDWPLHSSALAAFVLFAAIVTLLAALYAPLDLRGQTYWSQVLRDALSFAVGLLFFIVAVWSSRSESGLRRALKWLYAGLLLTFLWSMVQALAIHTAFVSRELITEIQTSFSIRRLLIWRVSGFAYEPSWLADQLVILYLPWLAAALLSGYRLTRFRWLEPVLLGLIAVLLPLTFSRSGILGALAVLAAVFVLTGQARFARAWAWFRAPFQNKGTSGRTLRFGIIGLTLVAVVAAGWWLSQYRYFSRIVDLSVEGGLLGYVVNIGAGPRLAYSWAALKVFATHPWTGVGLGGSGLYLYNSLPDWSLMQATEIARRLSPDSLIIANVKNLYARLLAETGLIGFWLFVAFFLSVLSSVRQLLNSAQPYLRYVGIAGLVIWLAVALRNFTQDSLTFPVMWVGLGMIVGYACNLKSSQS